MFRRIQSSLVVGWLFLSFCVVARAAEPERKVEQNVVTSERAPKIRIALPRTVQYVGADRWNLLGIADCELHAFVEANEQRKVQRLYWIQFEQYLPDKPDLHHQYDSPRHIAIGGLDFYVDTWAKPSDQKPTPASDEEHIRNLIDAKGYTMPVGMIYVRLVHLLDDQKRKELMIIYAEDVAPSGYAAVDLRENGKHHDQLSLIDKGLIERAAQRISIELPK